MLANQDSYCGGLAFDLATLAPIPGTTFRSLSVQNPLAVDYTNVRDGCPQGPPPSVPV